ncbi:MAG TPA: hypothetical protein VGA79_00665 [Desulfobaccales bacterium]
MIQFLIKSAELIKGLIVSPISELNKIKEGLIPKNIIYRIFIITMIITIGNVPFRERGRMGDYIPNRYLTEIGNFISHPFVLWMAAYLFYFCSIFIMVKLCNLFTGQRGCRHLPYLVMSVSGIGIAAQVLFFPLNYILSRQLLMFLGLFFRFWNLVLIFLAIKVSSSLSNMKSFSIVAITVVIITIFTFAIGTFMDPYLFFLF